MLMTNFDEQVKKLIDRKVLNGRILEICRISRDYSELLSEEVQFKLKADAEKLDNEFERINNV